jgi:hypothetical protein
MKSTGMMAWARSNDFTWFGFAGNPWVCPIPTFCNNLDMMKIRRKGRETGAT